MSKSIKSRTAEWISCIFESANYSKSPSAITSTYITVALQHAIVSRKELIRQSWEKPVLVAGAYVEGRL